MDIVEIVVLILAAWRLTVLFLQDTGPFNFLDRIRHRAGAHVDYEEAGELGRLLQCPYCFSVWVGIALVLAVLTVPQITWPVAYMLALSAGAVLIEEIR